MTAIKNQKKIIGGKDVVHFNSATHDRVSLTTNILYGARTVSVCVTPETTTFNGQDRQFILSQYTTSGKRTTYWEFRDTGVIRVYLPTTQTGNGYELIESDPGVYFTGGEEINITVTREDPLIITDGSARTKMYVNGVQQAQVSTNTLPFTRYASAELGNWSLQTSNFTGNIRRLTGWNIHRTQAEVIADKTRIFIGTETGLKFHFEMDEGAGPVINDATGTYTGNIITTSTNPTYVNDVMRIKA